MADLIAADSEAAIAWLQPSFGVVCREGIEKLRQELITFASLIELELDFSEEDVEFADRFAMTETVIRIKDMVDRLASSSGSAMPGRVSRL